MSSFDDIKSPEISAHLGSKHPINQMKDFLLDVSDLLIKDLISLLLFKWPLRIAMYFLKLIIGIMS